jgi:chromosome segregation ATPase
MTEREQFNNWWNNKKEHISEKEAAWGAWQEAKKNTAANIIALGQQLADKEETLNAMDLEIDAMKDANRVLNEKIISLKEEIRKLRQFLLHEHEELEGDEQYRVDGSMDRRNSVTWEEVVDILDDKEEL